MEVTLNSLVKKAVAQRTATKRFTALFSRLDAHRPVSDAEYTTALLELPQRTSYQADLAATLALSSRHHLVRFWRNLGLVPPETQALFLAKLAVVVQRDKLDAEIAREFVVQFKQYALTWFSAQLLLLSVQLGLATQIVVVLIAVVSAKNTPNVADFVIEALAALKKLNLRPLLQYLYTKTKDSLSSAQVDQLYHDKVIAAEHPWPIASTAQPLVSHESTASSIHNALRPDALLPQNLEFYTNSKKYYWFTRLMRSWKFNDDALLDNYIANFIHGTDANNNSRSKNSYVVAFDLISSVFNGFGTAILTHEPCYVLFNWKNFIVSRVPVILASLKFSSTNPEESIEAAALAAFNSVPENISKTLANVHVGTTATYDIRQLFIKGCIFNKLLSPQSFQKFFPMESKINQQVIVNELSQYNLDLNLKQKFNEKLLFVNLEFSSLEESGLLDFINSLPPIVGYLHKKQLELSNIVIKIIDDLIKSKDYDKLNRLLLSILNNVQIVSIIAFNCGPYLLLDKLIDYIDKEKFNIDDDENFQEQYSYFGVALLGILLLIELFQIDFSKIQLKNSYFVSYVNEFYYRLCDNLTNQNPTNDDPESTTVTTNYNSLMNDWINALFDDSNDGLSDDLIKSVNIKQIYKLIPIIFQQAIIATKSGAIGVPILTNGIDYLSQVFLIPCTVSIINWLLREIRVQKAAPDSILVRALYEIIKSCGNLGGEDGTSNSQDTPSLIFNIVINITGSNTLLTLKQFKDWENLELVKDIVSNIERKKDGSFAEVSKRVLKKNATIKDLVKHTLLQGPLHASETNDTSGTVSYGLILLLLNESQEQTLERIVEDTLELQKNHDEDTKIFIDLISYIVILNSVENADDKQYWYKTLATSPSAPSKPTPGKPVGSEQTSFVLTVDSHFASIFNDDDESSTETRPEDEFMIDDDDLFSEKPKATPSTSKKLQTLRKQAGQVGVFLRTFEQRRSVEFHHDATSANSRAFRLLTENIIDELNSLYV